LDAVARADALDDVMGLLGQAAGVEGEHLHLRLERDRHVDERRVLDGEARGDDEPVAEQRERVTQDVLRRGSRALVVQVVDVEAQRWVHGSPGARPDLRLPADRTGHFKTSNGERGGTSERGRRSGSVAATATTATTTTATTTTTKSGARARARLEGSPAHHVEGHA